MSDRPDDMESIFNEAAGVTPSKPASVPVPTTPQQQNARRANEIFSDQPKVKEMSREQYARQELGIDIPIDACPLPSRGLVYSPDSPLYLAEHVDYRSMTAREEDILMSRALIKKGTMVTELIKSCLMDKNIDVRSLLSGDRTALMIAIRISGYGRDYVQGFNCPKCEAKNEMHTDLANLDIKSLEIEPVEPGHNLFAYVLPVTKKNVLFKFLTAADEEKIVQELDARKKRGNQNDNLITTKLISSIVSIDGNDNRGDIVKFVNYMPAMDSRSFRKYLDDNDPGVKMEVEFQCSSCDYFDNIALPLGSEFFWPGAK